MRNLYCGEEANDLKSCSVSWASIKAAKMSRNEGSGRKRGLEKTTWGSTPRFDDLRQPFFFLRNKIPSSHPTIENVRSGWQNFRAKRGLGRPTFFPKAAVGRGFRPRNSRLFLSDSQMVRTELANLRFEMSKFCCHRHPTKRSCDRASNM